MATDHVNGDPLRNPQVDYERADLSQRVSLLADQIKKDFQQIKVEGD